MHCSKLSVFIVAFCVGLELAAQKLPVPAPILRLHVKKHINTLAHDSLEGRLIGSKGEQMAYRYITERFKDAGAVEAGDSGYLQPFTIRKNLKNPHAAADNDSSAISVRGYNVIGKIDNGAEHTVIIGAHYDHLGYDEYGGSTWRPEKKTAPQIHNGADDNASGTAALIELATLLKRSPLKRNNYLFIAFSGEEEGLLGSNYFMKHPTIDTSKVTYMINMDMVGRLDTVKNSFIISGTGTSPVWQGTLEQIAVDGLKPKFDPSGTGASDHTSFYNAGIPALHFFTGSHSDYHKPSDDKDKININGEVSIITYIYRLIEKLDGQPVLAFTRTKEDSSTRIAFKVTLGIMPDYLYEGKGVRVDGVTDGRPASKAGILKGDVILGINELKTEDMQQYMKALGAFKKGDEVTVKLLRGTKETTVQAVF
jgi:hypothetical protein